MVNRGLVSPIVSLFEFDRLIELEENKVKIVLAFPVKKQKEG